MNLMTIAIKGEGAGWNSCHQTPFVSIPTINVIETGKNINRMRIEADISVKDMQQVFGFTTPQAIYKWIHGMNLPTIDNMIILAAMFNVTVDEILITEEKVVAIELKKERR